MGGRGGPGRKAHTRTLHGRGPGGVQGVVFLSFLFSLSRFAALEGAVVRNPRNSVAPLQLSVAMVYFVDVYELVVFSRESLLEGLRRDLLVSVDAL